jgi:hypothetical protein
MPTRLTALIIVFYHLLVNLVVSAAKELVREIEEYQGLRALRLEGNTVGVEAAQAISKALECKDQLQVLGGERLEINCLSPRMSKAN